MRRVLGIDEEKVDCDWLFGEFAQEIARLQDSDSTEHFHDSDYSGGGIDMDDVAMIVPIASEFAQKLLIDNSGFY